MCLLRQWRGRGRCTRTSSSFFHPCTVGVYRRQQQAQQRGRQAVIRQEVEGAVRRRERDGGHAPSSVSSLVPPSFTHFLPQQPAALAGSLLERAAGGSSLQAVLTVRQEWGGRGRHTGAVAAPWPVPRLPSSLAWPSCAACSACPSACTRDAVPAPKAGTHINTSYLPCTSPSSLLSPALADPIHTGRPQAASVQLTPSPFSRLSSSLSPPPVAAQSPRPLFIFSTVLSPVTFEGGSPLCPFKGCGIGGSVWACVGVW